MTISRRKEREDKTRGEGKGNRKNRRDEGTGKGGAFDLLCVLNTIHLCIFSVLRRYIQRKKGR